MISMTKYRGHEILPDDLLLGQEDLGRHGAEIAKNHNEVENRAFAGILLRRLTECMKKIDDVHEALNENQDSAIPMPPAGEWLLDNHYLIQEQAEMVEHFLKGCRGTMLPALMGGRMKGYPRIYAVALELVAHTDGAVDEKSLIHFIKSYQANQGLSMGELWSLSGMLRLSLVEKIRLLCGRLEVTLNQKNNAENLLRQMLTEDTSREDKWLDLSGLATGVLHPSFVEHLSRGLRKKGYPLSVMDQLEVRLEERDQDIAGVIEREHGNQAGMQASLGNAVTSLRIMGEMDWTKLFEELSQVEQILRGDPSGVYKEMDPQSRQLYRSKVHKLASVCHVSEMSVAKRAVEWAGKAGKDSIEGHVGYHLAGRGAQLFKDSLGRRRADHRTGSGNREEGPSADHRYGSGNSIDRSERAGHRSSKNEMASMKTGRKIPFQVYAGTILAVAAVITAALCYYAAGMGEYSIPYAVAMTALLVVLPAADVATRLVNLGAAFLVKPEILPKMELEGGIPENLATMVILPTLLTSVKRGKDLVRSMETIYLANREEHLYFALLGDFKDSQEREMPEDARIAEATLAEIRSLNSKYSKDGKDRFYYFNRRREFNEKQSSWMGWERKRGAILEFNELLLEEAANKEANINNSKDGSDSKEMNNFPAGKDSVAGKVSKAGRLGSGYTIRSSGLEGLPPVRYVITLDADTTLPIDGGRKLVGCLSHPLNSPVMEEGSEVVKEGYGILQPRVGVTIHAANGSLFSKIFAGAGGQDPYTTAVSDVYQDLFGEGIFTGKGIYDLEVFQKILRKSIGDNKVLSHDLLEGSFVRAGLVTDILLMDGYPSRYNGWAMRLHRWVRGDWQLLPWLLPDITNGCEEKMVNPLSGLSRWKIADNMRRSLTTPATLALLTIGPFLLPGHFSIWMGLALLDIFHALWGAVLNRLLAFTKGVGRAPVEPTVMAGLTGALLQGLLNLSFLPYEAFLLLGAITRTLYRVLISHRNMLQWVTAADMEACLSNNLGSFIKRMWVGGALGLSFAYLAFLFSPGLLIASILLLSIWSGAPMLAYFISLPARVGNHPLSTEEAGRLRRDGRKIWAFYEDFAGAGDNYLPPDNYQEEPVRRIAHRTSPTNMGFMLLGILNARDLGYIGTFEMLQRLDRVLGTMEKLERWKGHFFNWYDTTTLEVLKPGYISTVDSGNLAGYLLVLEQAMEEYAN